jgi:hypothetical protein
MYDIEVLPIGDAMRSGDAIMFQFSPPGIAQPVRVIIDGGFLGDGDRVVETFTTIFDSDEVGLVVLTHPDGDHIGGLGSVVRNLRVHTLAAHRPALHGGSSLRASEAVEDLVRVAQQHGVVDVVEPFAGTHAFGQALLVAGPTQEYYEELIQEQVAQEASLVAATRTAAGSRIVQRLAAVVLPRLPGELPFDDAGGDTARNNSAAIIDLRVGDERTLFTSDAGVPALNRAADVIDAWGRADVPIKNFQAPHHGSRHNMDSDTFDRLLGAPRDYQIGNAFVSISGAAADDPRYPSPRVTNACLRRGYPALKTGGLNLQLHSPDVPLRPGYVPAIPIPPLDDSIDNR